ncbi:Homocysteine S-methyltransferase 2 [Sesamum angolense]|uniref:Homocysteine S-methyltransferase 2 n=1 Tax=Sesamum angolense TaxID=2727404 RepID=A0AAE2C1P5_9LAMI|nr:Homocysteine S-methyltransferase 2 [Sesamum angolense]
MTSFLRQCGGYAVIDGGLATELERHGADLNDPLWSAKCLINSPHLIRTVHLDYLEAGANIIISASYQATLQGFEAKGLSRKEGEALLEKSVKIACEARDIYYDRATKGSWDISGDVLTRKSILFWLLHRGIYGDNIGLETLKDFHRRRVQVLAESGADLIAFETIPNKLEAMAYAELLEEEAVNIPAWFSFSSKDGINVVSGDPIQDCALIADSCEQVVAVGVNCTPPRFIHGLIQSIQTVTTKPILVYPTAVRLMMPAERNGCYLSVNEAINWSDRRRFRIIRWEMARGWCFSNRRVLQNYTKHHYSYFQDSFKELIRFCCKDLIWKGRQVAQLSALYLF